jgi:hypothetical protein
MIMNRKLAWILVFSLSLVAFAHGQTANNAAQVVFGNGTPNYLPVWTGHNIIGNSILFQSGGSLGLGTTSPQGTLDVESNQFNGLFAVTSSSAQYSRAISATAIAQAGQSYGIVAETRSTTDFSSGVIGLASAVTGNSFGVFGAANSPSGTGVFGYVSATSGYPVAVDAHFASPTGIAGRFYSSSGSGLLLQGDSGSSFTQVFYVDASGNGYFAGNLNVTGNLSKGSGSFKIDDPLDPANKTLSHSFVESPDMMNIYNGVVQLDAKGQAWVDLPQYFEALNRDFRYQLTAVGAPGPNLYVAQEIADNHFKIEGGKPGAKVSWQVTGVRQDAYANAHRVPVEEDKVANERGHYLHPDAFGQPQSKGIEFGKGTQHGTIDPAKFTAISYDRQKSNQ